MKIIDAKSDTITKIIPVNAPTAIPARAVPNMVIKMADTIPPNAPATVAFQKPLNVPITHHYSNNKTCYKQA